jgi:hypothetical protein
MNPKALFTAFMFVVVWLLTFTTVLVLTHATMSRDLPICVQPKAHEKVLL